MCRENLSWYRTIQGTLGSVEESAFGQLEDITKHGKFIVHIGQGIPKDICGLVKVQVLTQHSAKYEYSLDDLKYLQSKLAFIENKMTEKDIRDMADTFWQVCYSACTHGCFSSVKKKLTHTSQYQTSLLSVAVL